MMRMRVFLLVVVCFISCSQPDFYFGLAPGVTHADNLAFVVEEARSKHAFCRTLLAVSSPVAFSSSVMGDSYRDDWKIETSEPLPCPNPFKWGQDFGKGWEVKIAPLPLERNRSYRIILEPAYKKGNVYIEFCIFKNGTIVSHSYSDYSSQDHGDEPVEDFVRCEEEGRQDAAAPQTE